MAKKKETTTFTSMQEYKDKYYPTSDLQKMEKVDSEIREGMLLARSAFLTSK